MNPASEFLLLVLAALALGFTVIWTLHWLRADDKAANVVIGRASGPQTADHGPRTKMVYLRRCAWCAQLQGPAVTLQPGQPFSITDGLCQDCERRHFPKDEATSPQTRCAIAQPA